VEFFDYTGLVAVFSTRSIAVVGSKNFPIAEIAELTDLTIGQVEALQESY
jgi:hypothetical protein